MSEPRYLHSLIFHRCFLVVLSCGSVKKLATGYLIDGSQDDFCSFQYMTRSSDKKTIWNKPDVRGISQVFVFIRIFPRLILFFQSCYLVSLPSSFTSWLLYKSWGYHSGKISVSVTCRVLLLIAHDIFFAWSNFVAVFRSSCLPEIKAIFSLPFLFLITCFLVDRALISMYRVGR